MKTLECWNLISIGQDSDSLVARFSSPAEAEKAKPRAGGYRGEVRAEKIVIYDSAIEFDPTLDTKSVQSGLAKLTAQEKAALKIGD